MSLLIAVLILGLLGVVVLVVAAPLRERNGERGAVAGAAGGARELERAQLEAAREAKYREIRDCELDFRTGKLSAADHASLDAQLRAEALEILDRLERLEAEDGEALPGAG